MQLFFVASSDGYHGENGDLFVWAHDRDQAVRLWDEHYELENTVEPDHVWRVPLTDPGQPMVLRWDVGMVKV